MNAAAEFPHVLVVDDNQDAAEVLALLIEMEGFTVATAGTLAQGREQIARQRPDMILLDLNLPDGSGMNLLEEIKSDQATATINVVVLSGMVEARIKERAQLLGASAVLVKPLTHEQLTSVLCLAR